jgi:hypothetical protein
MTSVVALGWDRLHSMAVHGLVLLIMDSQMIVSQGKNTMMKPRYSCVHRRMQNTMSAGQVMNGVHL